MVFSYSGMLIHFCGASGDAEVAAAVHVGGLTVSRHRDGLDRAQARGAAERLGRLRHEGGRRIPRLGAGQRHRRDDEDTNTER